MAPDRHGKLRHRLRRTVKGRKVDVYLPGPYGSPAFRAAYEAALEGTRIAAPRAQGGTVAFLIESYLASTAFQNLAQTTRTGKRNRLDWIKQRESLGLGGFVGANPPNLFERSRGVRDGVLAMWKVRWWRSYEGTIGGMAVVGPVVSARATVAVGR